MTRVQVWQQDLVNILGESNVVSDEERDQYVIDGKSPRFVVFPTTIEQISEIMRWSSKSQVPIIPMGNGSKLGIGNLPLRVDVLLSTLKLDQVIEYEPANLTATLQSGLRLTALQERLAGSGQFFPLDPPYQDFGTVGGTIASNVSGPMRLKYGTSRDVVIGIRVVQPDGTVIKGGGKVVKNVAGYDLNKLFVGSYGTLGVIVEVSVKLQPLPAESRHLLARFDSIDQAIHAGQEIVTSQLAPTLVTGATSLPSAQLEQPCLVVSADGHPETVAWQMDQFAISCQNHGATAIDSYSGSAGEALHKALVIFPEARWVEPRVVCKIGIPSTQLADVVAQASELARASNLRSNCMVHIGNGIIYYVIATPDGEPDMGLSVSIVKQLRESIRPLGGFLILQSAPFPVKREVDTWGTVGKAFPLMRKIKDSLDPGALMSPGRFVGGL